MNKRGVILLVAAAFAAMAFTIGSLDPSYLGSAWIKDFLYVGQSKTSPVFTVNGTSGDIRTSGSLTALGSLDVANTVTANAVEAGLVRTSGMLLAGDKFRADGATGDLQTSGALTTFGDISTNANNVYINRDGPAGDQNIYFYHSGSPTHAAFGWNSASGQFEINRTIKQSFGYIYVGSTIYSPNGYYEYGNGLYLGLSSSSRRVMFRDIQAIRTFTTGTAQGVWQAAQCMTKSLMHSAGTTSYTVWAGATDYISTGSTKMDWQLPPFTFMQSRQTTGSVTAEITFTNGTSTQNDLEPYRSGAGVPYDSTFWLAGTTYKELILSQGAVVTIKAAPLPNYVWLVKSTQGTVSGR